MSTPATTKTAEYELVLMLDPEAPDDRRDQIATEARKRIESTGSLKEDRAWGMRKMAYEIRQRTEADYRFFRFETASPLLDELDHNLKITDGVLRFRIFKVDPRLPVIDPPPPIALAGSAPRGGSGRRGGPGGRSPRGSAPQGDAPTPPPDDVAPPAEEAAPPAAEAAPPAEEPAPESAPEAETPAEGEEPAAQ